MIWDRQEKDLAKEFNECRPILSVLGDTTRQSIILCLLENIQCGGMRVGELSSVIHISRTALSHHFKNIKRKWYCCDERRRYKEFLLLELSESTYGFFSQIIS